MAYNTPTSKLTVSQFIDTRYWPVAGAGLCAEWKELSEYYLRLIRDKLGDCVLDEITVEQAEGWLRALRAAHRRPTTPNKVLVRFKHLMASAQRWGLIQTNPAEHLTRKREPIRRFKFLTPEQFEILFNKPRGRLRYHVRFAMYTGARRKSLASLETKDVDLRQGTLLFRATKNGEDWGVPIHPALWETLGTLLSSPIHSRQKAKAKLLPQYKDYRVVSKCFNRFAHKQGLAGFRFHDFRHDVGSRLYAIGGTKMSMQGLGHNDPKAASRYQHIPPETFTTAFTAALTRPSKGVQP